MDMKSISYNRLALVGVLVYLAEWIFIIGYYADPPAATAAAADLAAYFDGRLAETQVYTIGVAAAVLGLLAFGAGLRTVLVQVPRVKHVADFGFAALIVAVAVEVQAMATMHVLHLVGATSQEFMPLAAAWQRAQDGVGIMLVARGLFACVMAVASLRSGLFPSWVNWVGFLGGLVYAGSALGGVVPGGEVLELLQFGGWLAMLIWMLTLAIILFRRSSRERRGARGGSIQP